MNLNLYYRNKTKWSFDFRICIKHEFFLSFFYAVLFNGVGSFIQNKIKYFLFFFRTKLQECLKYYFIYVYVYMFFVVWWLRWWCLFLNVNNNIMRSCRCLYFRLIDLEYFGFYCDKFTTRIYIKWWIFIFFSLQCIINKITKNNKSLSN